MDLAKLLMILALGIGFLGVVLMYMALKKRDDYISSMDENGQIIGSFDDFDGIKDLVSDSTEIIMTFQEGKNKIDVYGKTDQVKIEEYFEIKDEGSLLRIKSLKPASKLSSDWLRLDFYMEDIKNVNLDLGAYKGMVEIKDKIGSLKARSFQGSLVAYTKEAFDLDIKTMDGVLDLNFEEKNPGLILDSYVGTVDIYGDKTENRESPRSFVKNEESEKKISIKNFAGSLDID